MKSRLLLAALAVGLVLNGTARVTAAESPDAGGMAIDPGNLRAFIALARADLKVEKTLIIAQNISFSADEAVEFWPLHAEYTVALNRLLDERLALLGEYVATYQDMNDAQATSLAHRVFDLEGKRVKLKRTWFKKFSKVVPAKKAAQFFQIENQLNAALDLQLAAALPLIR